MIFQIFTKCLQYKPLRLILLQVKKKWPQNFNIVPMILEWKQKDFVYQNTSINLLGEGSIKKFNVVCQDFSFKKALIVSDKILIQTGVASHLVEQLKNNHIDYFLYDGVMPNPTIEIVNEVTNLYREKKCDSLISVGGGSSHDTIKAAALCLTNDKPLKKYQGLNMTDNEITIPIICINTTAGTGSGTTNVSVITDSQSHFKMTLTDKNIQPNVLIEDSELMLGLPAKPSTWVGVDTLVHAIEAYLSPIQSVINKAFAKKAIQIVFSELPKVYKNISDSAAREKMAYAEFMAGAAFNNASLGFVHSLSHALSGTFNTPHGLANAIMLPYVLDYELFDSSTVNKISEIASLIGLNNENNDKLTNAKKFISHIVNFLKDLNIPNKLTDVQANITPNHIKSMAKKAMKDFCGITNPMQFFKKEVIHIYQNAILGKFDNIN